MLAFSVVQWDFFYFVYACDYVVFVPNRDSWGWYRTQQWNCESRTSPVYLCSSITFDKSHKIFLSAFLQFLQPMADTGWGRLISWNTFIQEKELNSEYIVSAKLKAVFGCLPRFNRMWLLVIYVFMPRLLFFLCAIICVTWYSRHSPEHTRVLTAVAFGIPVTWLPFFHTKHLPDVACYFTKNSRLPRTVYHLICSTSLSLILFESGSRTYYLIVCISDWFFYCMVLVDVAWAVLLISLV